MEEENEIMIPESITKRLLGIASKYPEWELILKTFMDAKEIDLDHVYRIDGSLKLTKAQ